MFQKATLANQTAVIILSLSTAGASAALGQGRSAQDDEWCRDRSERDRGWYCEVREQTLSADRDVIRVAGHPNGGIKVYGWDRNEIQLRARVAAHADTDSEARSMVSEVRVLTEGQTIRADGPRTHDRDWWSASFEVFVPHNSNLSLETTNGGITVEEVEGDIDFRTTNGGVRLIGVAGDVRGRATNGGLRIELTGTEWEGEGMDVQTTNGGVTMMVPDDYSAHLVTGTINGGMRIDFPVMVQGRIDRRLSVDLGTGGRTVRAVTTNGGVKITRK